MEPTLLTEADYQQIYLYQVQQTERDRNITRIVTVLQGLAAIFTIVVAVGILTKKS